MIPLGNSLRVSSFLLLLALVPRAAAQGPPLGSAALLPGAASTFVASGDQKAPAFALGQDSTLVVFEDGRGGDLDVVGIRLDATGQPLDARPFPIARSAGTQTTAKVAWNGQNWLVVYSNQVPTASNYFQYEVAAKRVSPSGQVLDADPISLGADSTGGNFAVTSDGANWLVAATGYTAGNSDIVGWRIDNAGTVLDAAPVVIQPGTYYVFFNIQAAYVQGQYVIAWNDASLVKARRFSSTLQPLDGGQPASLTSSGKLGSNGSDVVMLWVRQTPAFMQEVAMSWYDASLQPLSPAPIPLTTAEANVSLDPVGLVHSGGTWIAAWTTVGSQVAKAARVTSQGTVLDFDGITIAENNPSVLYGPTLGALANGGAAFAWHDARLNDNNVYSVALTQVLASKPELCLSLASEAQRSPRVAAGPSHQFLVTYRADTSAGSRILAQRVDRNGVAIDVNPLEVASAPNAKLFAGGAAWNGSLYLVAYSDQQQGKVFARRLASDGTWIDASPIAVQNGGSADVAALGGDFLVSALRVVSTNPQFIASYGMRVRGLDGALLDPTPLPLAGSYATRSRITTLGGKWLVATEVHATHDANASSVQATFVDAAGVVTPPVVVATANIQNWGIVDVASSGSSALFVYQSGSNWVNVDVFARRMNVSGSLTGSTVNVTGGDVNGQLRPTIVWTGDDYFVAFETYQNNPWFYDFETDVYGARVSESGVLLDAQPFALWNTADWEVTPHAASHGDGRALFASSVYDEPTYGAFHVSTRALGLTGLTNFGTGTAGCAGLQTMDASPTPKVGQSAFTLQCSHGPAHALGLCLVGNAVNASGIDSFGLGILLHVDPFASTELFGLDLFSDGAGLGSAAAPIPPDPALAGLTYAAQAVWAWPTVCGASPFGLSSSDGLSIVIQAP